MFPTFHRQWQKSRVKIWQIQRTYWPPQTHFANANVKWLLTNKPHLVSVCPHCGSPVLLCGGKEGQGLHHRPRARKLGGGQAAGAWGWCGLKGEPWSKGGCQQSGGDGYEVGHGAAWEGCCGRLEARWPTASNKEEQAAPAPLSLPLSSHLALSEILSFSQFLSSIIKNIIIIPFWMYHRSFRRFVPGIHILEPLW